MPQVKCKICNKEFYVKPSHQLLGWGKYCSRACSHDAQKKGRKIKCDLCEKEVWKSPNDLSRSKSGNHFCSKTCQTIWRNKTYVGEKHSLWSGGQYSYRAAMKRSGADLVCKKCGNDDKRLLAVHHLDCNRKNNKKENLVWLCYNCHHLVHLYKVKI